MGDTVTLWDPPTDTDAYGAPVGDWTPVWTGPANVQPLAGEENRVRRETIDLRLRVFLPAEAPVTHIRRLSVADGPPLNIFDVRRWGDRGTPHHIEVTVDQEVP